MHTAAALCGALAFVAVAGWGSPARAEPRTEASAAAPAKVPAREVAAPAPVGASDPAPRILAGAGLGLVGGVAGFALGFWSAEAWAPTSDDDGHCDACGIERLGWAVLGGTVVATAGVSFGSYAGSEWAGGDGSLGYTVLGGVLGSVAALGLAAGELKVDMPGAVIVGTLVAVPIAGALLGYELSSGGDDSATGGTLVSARLGVTPLAGGAQLGLRGSF